MSEEKEQIRIVLERAQRIDEALPDWIHRVEELNRLQYERSKSLASSELEKKTIKSKTMMTSS